MAPSRRFGSAESVVCLLWEAAFVVFVLRLALVYAGLAVAATAVLAGLAHAVVLPLLAAQQHVAAQTLLDRLLGAAGSAPRTALLVLVLVCAGVCAVVAACARALMACAKIPQLRGYRAALGAAAAAYVALGWLAAALFVRPPSCLPAAAAAAAKTPTPTNPHAATPTGSGTMSLAAFCQKSRLAGLGSSSSRSSVSACTVVGLVFVAAVALMPWLSMVLLESPSRRRTHARSASGSGWSTPAKTSVAGVRAPLEKAPLAEGLLSDDGADQGQDAPRRAPAKRYALRTASERRPARQ